VWHHQGNIDANWHQAQVSITNTTTYTIVFEGLRGISFLGDIGIDDIKVTDGTCGERKISFSWCSKFPRFEPVTFC
jgi:hypothetical protein